MSTEFPVWEQPTLAEWLDALRSIGVVRAATWFDNALDASAFAVSFRDGPHEPTDELQQALYGITSCAAQAVLPEFGDDAQFEEWDERFLGGELAVEVDAATITVALTHGAREEQDTRLTVDLTSTESLFARSEDESPGNELERSESEWDVEWNAADRAVDLQTGLAEIEDAMIAFGADPEATRDLMSGLEELAADDEDDEEDDLDPAAALETLGAALAELRAAGVRHATIGYSGWDVMLGALQHGVGEAFAHGPWRLGDVELDGRAASDGPSVSAARSLAETLLVARLGDWNETGPTSERSGVLDLDVEHGTATLTHRSPTWRRLSTERVVLGPEDQRSPPRVA